PTGKRDVQLEKDYDYLLDVCHTFRLRKDTFDSFQRKAGKNPKELKSKVTIYVAKEFPEWQQIVLDTIKSLYEASGTKTYPDNKQLSQALGKIDQLKKYMKKVMPFSVSRLPIFKEQGESSFDKNNKTIDETAVLEQNIDYLRCTLGVE